MTDSAPTKVVEGAAMVVEDVISDGSTLDAMRVVEITECRKFISIDKDRLVGVVKVIVLDTPRYMMAG